MRCQHQVKCFIYFLSHNKKMLFYQVACSTSLIYKLWRQVHLKTIVLVHSPAEFRDQTKQNISILTVQMWQLNLKLYPWDILASQMSLSDAQQNVIFWQSTINQSRIELLGAYWISWVLLHFYPTHSIVIFMIDCRK